MTSAGPADASTTADDTSGTTVRADSSGGTAGDAPSSTTGGAYVCDPAPDETLVGYSEVDSPNSVFEGAQGYEVECEVLEVTLSVQGRYELSLDCEDGPHSLEFTEHGDLDLAAGQTTTLARGLMPLPDELYADFAVLRRDGEVVFARFAVFDVPGAVPPTPLPGFYAPVEIDRVTGVCELEPQPLEDGCAAVRRTAMEISDGARSVTVYDSNEAMLGPLHITVAAAREFEDIQCDGTAAGSWFVLLQRVG